MTPGEYLRQTRLSKTRTLADVAAAYGCSVPFLSDVERGLRNVPRRRPHRAALCMHYGADLDVLDRLCAAHCDRIDVSFLTAEQRERVALFIAGLTSR